MSFNMKVFFIVLFGLLALARCETPKGHTIELHRQKTAFEQHLNNAHLLEKLGSSVDWLYKKHRHVQEPRTNDSVNLYRFLDNEFYATIVIGHPGQTLNVGFDTSWALTWVISAECHDFTNMGCWFHHKYDHDKSSYYKKDGRKISISEGNSTLSGYFSYENISFAHSNVTNFLFAEMTDLPRTLLFSKIDGVIGLGLKHDSYDPFFYSLLAQKKIVDPIFCVYLNRDKQSNRGGNIILGFIEMRHVHSKKDENNNTIYDDIKYMPVKPGYYWEFDMDMVYVHEAKEDILTFCAGKDCTAFTDTGSNDIVGPKDDIEAIHRVLKARPFFLGRHTINCDTINKLPVIGFTIGGQNFTLKGRDYTVKMSYLSMTLCLTSFMSHGPELGDNVWVLGGAFLSEYYTIYKMDTKQIGIVKAA